MPANRNLRRKRKASSSSSSRPAGRKVPRKNPSDLVSYDGGQRQQRLPILMDDTLEYIMSFLMEYEDIVKCSLLCKRIRSFVQSERIRRRVVFSGRCWGNRPDLDTLERRLTPFVRAGNPDALHFLGMALYYCKSKVRRGIELMMAASKAGHLDATYDAALILRKQNPAESTSMLKAAAARGHLPSWIEISSERISSVIAENKQRPKKMFENQQKPPVYSFMRDYWDARGRGNSRCWCSAGCGRHRLTSAERRKVLLSDPTCPRMILRKCARCFVAKYCSRLCQVVSWDNGHRDNCLPSLPQFRLINPANGNVFANITLLENVELEVHRMVNRERHRPRDVGRRAAQLVLYQLRMSARGGRDLNNGPSLVAATTSAIPAPAATPAIPLPAATPPPVPAAVGARQ